MYAIYAYLLEDAQRLTRSGGSNPSNSKGYRSKPYQVNNGPYLQGSPSKPSKVHHAKACK